MSSRNKQVKNKVGNRKAGSRIPQKNIKLAPPPFIAQALRKIVIRTQASSANTLTITMQQLAQLCGCSANTATTSSLITPLIKVNKILMWGQVATAGTPVTTSLTWVNMSEDFESPPRTFSDTSVSFDRPAHIMQKPPRGSLAEKWHGSSLSDSIVVLTFPIGAIVDFHLEFMLMDNAVTFSTIAGPVLVGATVGQMYHHPVQAVLQPVTVNSL